MLRSMSLPLWLTVCSLSAPAGAAELEPTMGASLSASYWDLGTKVAAKPGLKLPLWNQPDSVLFADTSLHGEVSLELTPAYARVVPTLTFSPIAVLELSAHYAASGWFGTFSTIKPFDSPAAAATEEALAELDGQTGFGQRVGGEVTLQAKAGPVIVALWGSGERWWTEPSGGRSGCCFYESERELLFAWEETYLSGNGVLLYERTLDADAGRAFRVGSITNYSRAQTTEDVLLRSGLIGTYSTSAHWTFVLLAQPYLRSRTHDAAFPPFMAAQARWKM